MATLAVSSSSDNNNMSGTTSNSSEGEVDTVYNDLLNFLKSSRADLRKAAAEATLATLVNDDSSSDNDNNNNNVAQRLTTLNVIQPLCRIASTISPDHGSISALAALSVLCSHEQLGNQNIIDFMDAKGIGRMLEIALSSPPTPVGTAASISALDKKQKDSNGDNEENKTSSKLAQEWNVWRQQVNYACALLANATRTERGAVDFIDQSETCVRRQPVTG